MKVGDLEKGIPVPVRGGGKTGSGIKKKIETMEIGESFVIFPGAEIDFAKFRNCISSMANNENIKSGKTFTTRKLVSENGELSLRIWRIE